MELLDLNDDVLLHILPFLDPTDEFALSQTCTRFKEMCQSGWSSLTLNLGQETETNERTVKLTEDEKEILKISCDILQNMHISVDFSGASDFDRPSLYVLEKESEKWNLKKFCFEALNIDKLTVQQFCKMLGSVLMIPIYCLDLSKTRNAKLETLSILVQGWRCHYKIYRITLAHLIYFSNFSKSLKSLSLDCFFSREQRCIKSNFQYEYGLYEMSSYYSLVIGRYKNLQTLDINSIYLTNSLLEALSRPDRVSLQSMTLVLDIFHDEDITSWPQLVYSSPSLKVTVEAFYDASNVDVRRVLPAGVPIVSWKIYSFPRVMFYKRSKLEDMFGLLCLHKHTLQSVAVQNGSQMLCHSSLLEMVTQCSKLQSLYLQGRIHSDAILEIASLQRQWLKLGVLEKNIKFPFLRIWKESRQKNMTRLCEEVSEKLGYQWKLESEATYLTLFNRPVII